jgi:hypothetical protein
LTILHYQFIPPPVRYVLAESGPVSAPVGLVAGHFVFFEKRILLKCLDPKTAHPALPFDYYCPSVQDKLSKRVCDDCGLYFSTAIAMNSYRKVHNDASTTISFIQEVNDNNTNNDIHVIKNLNDWLLLIKLVLFHFKFFAKGGGSSKFVRTFYWLYQRVQMRTMRG